MINGLRWLFVLFHNAQAEGAEWVTLVGIFFCLSVCMFKFPKSQCIKKKEDCVLVWPKFNGLGCLGFFFRQGCVCVCVERRRLVLRTEKSLR